MKKTMFITSVIMVVVLAIALTTSSLAWFAAGGNQSVSVSNFVIQAKNNAAAAGLEISLAEASGWKTSNISLLSAEEIAAAETNDGIGISRASFIPMVPVGSLGEATDGKYSANAFYQLLRGEMYTSQTYVVDGQSKMASAATPVAIALDRTFYIRNTGESAATVTTTLTVAISGTATSYDANLYVALFDETGATYVAKVNETPASLTGDVTLLAFENSGSVANFVKPATVWVADALETSVNSATVTTASINKAASLTLEAATDRFDGQGNDGADGVLDPYPHKLRLLAWFDGAELNNQNSNTKVSIEIAFNIGS